MIGYRYTPVSRYHLKNLKIIVCRPQNLPIPNQTVKLRYQKKKPFKGRLFHGQNYLGATSMRGIFGQNVLSYTKSPTKRGIHGRGVSDFFGTYHQNYHFFDVAINIIQTYFHTLVGR